MNTASMVVIKSPFEIIRANLQGYGQWIRVTRTDPKQQLSIPSSDTSITLKWVIIVFCAVLFAESLRVAVQVQTRVSAPPHVPSAAGRGGDGTVEE